MFKLFNSNEINFVALSCTFFLISCGCPKQNKLQINGIVVAKSTNLPLANSAINISFNTAIKGGMGDCVQKTIKRSIQTDQSGKFEFSGDIVADTMFDDYILFDQKWQQIYTSNKSGNLDTLFVLP
jgi:hypothetical protein